MEARRELHGQRALGVCAPGFLRRRAEHPLRNAAAVFDAMDGKNAWTYSAMLSGLALHGDGWKALQVFDAMVREGHAPDGLLEDGLRCFDRMRLEHKVAPNACTTTAWWT